MNVIQVMRRIMSTLKAYSEPSRAPKSSILDVRLGSAYLTIYCFSFVYYFLILLLYIMIISCISFCICDLKWLQKFKHCQGIEDVVIILKLRLKCSKIMPSQINKIS